MVIDKDKLEIAMANICIGQYDLCEKAGINKQTYRNVRKGKNCKPVTVGKIAKALGICAEALIKSTDIS